MSSNREECFLTVIIIQVDMSVYGVVERLLSLCEMREG